MKPTPTANCITCYISQWVILAMTAACGWWLFVNEHYTSGGWMVVVYILCVVGWQCYPNGRRAKPSGSEREHAKPAADDGGDTSNSADQGA